MRTLQVFKCRQHNPRTTLLTWVLEARKDAFKLRDVSNREQLCRVKGAKMDLQMRKDREHGTQLTWSSLVFEEDHDWSELVMNREGTDLSFALVLQVKETCQIFCLLITRNLVNCDSRDEIWSIQQKGKNPFGEDFASVQREVQT